ncbi:hypothetical protein [Chitinophaga sp. S165]|uniref:hypothetical protein n=1 Tax=Chitinophaga sp. S165 TaxID=2135462 RepID=UPI000D719C71|nr:hypothetical protein [Chitinophaga sp. S165]PWV47081.1 hypothetical protein C7475_109169 [Chitinophaga sp. S165]
MFKMNANLYKLLAQNIEYGPHYVESVLDKIAGNLSAGNRSPYEVYETYIDSIIPVRKKINQYRSNADHFLLGYLHMQAGNACMVDSRKQHHFDLAVNEYKQYIHKSRRQDETLYVAYWKMAVLLERLNTPWASVEELLLQAFQVYPYRAESLREIIVHYYRQDNARAAYIFSSFCSNRFYRAQALLTQRWFVNEAFYKWELLYYHVPICLSIGKLKEAQTWYQELLACINQYPDALPAEEVVKIKAYAQHFDPPKRKSSPSALQITIS